MYELEVEGLPATAGSLNWYGPGQVTHQSVRTKTWEDWIRWTWMQSPNYRAIPIDGPVYMNCDFYFVRPKGHFNKKGKLNKKGRENPYPAWKKRYDLDKLLRAVYDALSTLAYIDDGQIVSTLASKRWGTSPGVHIRAYRVEGTEYGKDEEGHSIDWQGQATVGDEGHG